MCFHNACHRPFQKLCCGIVVIALTLLISFQAFAAEPLRIATLLSPPIGFLTDDGQPAGLYYEIGNLIAETAGLDYTNEVVPFARVLAGLEDGDVDLGLVILRDQNPKLVPVHFVHDIKNIVIGRKETRFESLADLHGKVVAQTRGTSYDEAFVQDQAIEKYYVVDSAQGLTMLMNDRVDAYIGPELPTWFDVQQLGYTRDDLGDPLVLNTRPIWVHVPAATVDAGHDCRFERRHRNPARSWVPGLNTNLGHYRLMQQESGCLTAHIFRNDDHARGKNVTTGYCSGVINHHCEYDIAVKIAHLPYLWQQTPGEERIPHERFSKID